MEGNYDMDYSYSVKSFLLPVKSCKKIGCRNSFSLHALISINTPMLPGGIFRHLSHVRVVLIFMSYVVIIDMS
jgi:hypothetical protein